jgi:tetratricopeptide (TPR) repeat protein
MVKVLNQDFSANVRNLLFNNALILYFVYYENPLISYSAGSLYSTTEDLLLYDKALYTTKLISQKSLDAMVTPFKNAGYGWEHISQKFNRTIIGHAGSGNGFSTYFMRVPSERVTIIILSNSDETSANKVAYDLAAIVFGAEYKLPEAQPREIITDVLLQKGVEAAVQKYHELKRSQPLTASPQSNNKFRERLLNSMGYDLIQNGRVKDAIAIFALNCEAFPQSSNAFDSLGEAYLLDKNYAKSLENYKKSVELDGKNTHAKDATRKIEELLKKL